MEIEGNDPIMAEIEECNLNWDADLAAGKESWTEWYIVEQDIRQRDPFESLAISLRNLQDMILR